MPQTAPFHTSSPDDLSLMAGAARREEQAWTNLVNRYNAMLYGIARRHGLNTADQEDVVQSTWLRLYRNIDRLREPAAVAGWLATAARRESWRRLAAGKREVPVEDTDRGVEAAPVMIDEEVIARERQLALHRAVEALPQRQRAVTQALLTMPSASYDALTAALGIPRGSIGPTRCRSIAQLRRDRELVQAVQG